VRVPGETDVPFVAALMSEHAAERVSEADVAREWSAPYIVLDRDARIEDDGYVLVESIDAERAWLSVYGRPLTQLMDWADAQARERTPRVLSGGWSTDEVVLAALRERGFRQVRSSHRMLLDLVGPGTAPEWPRGVAVRTFEEGDERLFYEVHQETFLDMWEPIEDTYEEWAHWFLEPPAFTPDLWFLAYEAKEPAGVAICSPHETRAECGWVRVLGVRRPWRRRGLARALLLHAFEEFRLRGFTTAGLGVDAESETGANRLYESVGMRTAARFDILERSG
jgi:ribosomal protein S18 acetylase RimI-like enzyme